MQLVEIGDNIRNCRKARGYNQDQLAELASLNRVTIAKYEAGKVEPGAKALIRIADALEISVDTLLGRNTEEQNDLIESFDKNLVELLVNLSPSDVQRVKDFVAGMKASQKA